MWRSLVLDLLAGRPRVALSRSHCLNGEVTTPFGQDPSQEGVEAKWRSLAGMDRDTPPWLVLGQRETPSGIVWSIAFCPGQAALPERAEAVLPMAAWVLEVLRTTKGPSGWHLRVTKAKDEWWGALWEGERCERVHGPHRTRERLLERCLHKVPDASSSSWEAIDVAWSDPGPGRLRELAGEQACGDLLSLEASMHRARIRERHIALARSGAIVAVFLLVCSLFGLFQFGAWRVRVSQERRLAAVRTELDLVGNLESRSRSLVDTLLSRREALAPNSSADLVLRSVAEVVPPEVKLQVFALEPTTDGFRARLEARFSEWSQVQPFSEALRSAQGVRRVAVVSQNRQSEAVVAVLEIEGVWP